MSVITSATKSKQVIASFNPNKRINNVSNKSHDGALSETPPVDKMAVLKSNLLDLNIEERTVLLRSIFSDDLNLIVTQEQERLEQENKILLEKALLEKVEQIARERSAEIDELKNELTQSISMFSKQQLTISIENEQQVIELVVASVFKLIEHHIDEPAVVISTIKSLSNKVLNEDKPVLKLNSRQYNLCDSLKNESDLFDKFTVVENKELLPFSYKLMLNSGEIEASLEDKLHHFIKIIMETYHSESVEVISA